MRLTRKTLARLAGATRIRLSVVTKPKLSTTEVIYKRALLEAEINYDPEKLMGRKVGKRAWGTHHPECGCIIEHNNKHYLQCCVRSIFHVEYFGSDGRNIPIKKIEKYMSDKPLSDHQLATYLFSSIEKIRFISWKGV